MTTERSFPVLAQPPDYQHESVPWRLVAPHERQAFRNHYQTLERLAERGGLSWGELIAVLEDRDWSKIDRDEARSQVLALVEASAS